MMCPHISTVSGSPHRDPVQPGLAAGGKHVYILQYFPITTIIGHPPVKGDL